MKFIIGFLTLLLISSNVQAAPLCFKEKRENLVADRKYKSAVKNQKSLIKRSEKATASLEAKIKRFNSAIAANQKKILVNQSKYEILCDGVEKCKDAILLQYIVRLEKNNISLAKRIEIVTKDTAKLAKEAAQSDQKIADAKVNADEKAQALKTCLGEDENSSDDQDDAESHQ